MVIAVSFSFKELPKWIFIKKMLVFIFKSKHFFLCDNLEEPTVLLVVFLLSIVSNKMFNTTYESLPEIDQKMLAELSSIYKQFEQSEDPLWTDKYSFQTQPLMLIKTNKDQGILQKTAYVVNVPMDNDFFLKKLLYLNLLGCPKFIGSVFCHQGT